jgi:hypothetical protein
MRQSQDLTNALAAALVVAALANASAAANRTWIGMNNKWNASNDNWNPADEPDANDAAILNGDFSVALANADESINGLSLSGSFDLDLAGNQITIGGVASLSGSGTQLLVGPLGADVIADEINVTNGATLAMRGGIAVINEETPDGALHIEAGGTMSGHGNFSTIYSVPAATKVLINDGTLIATSTAVDVAGSTASTLSINAWGGGDARIDLDGDGENGMVSVARNDTLDVNLRLYDAFSGTIVLSAGATLDIAAAWTLGAGEINPNTVGFAMGTAGPMATIAGGPLTQASPNASINLDAIDTLRIASVYTATAGSININGGTLILDGGGVIDVGANLNLQNGGVLKGFGVINANLSGDGSGTPERVLADNGVLTVALDAGFVGLVMGTDDSDGILEILPAWHTSNAQSVILAGGELRGGDITNDSSAGIRGHGLISARVVNESKIVAEGGGKLVLETLGDDNWWDGTSGAGILEAASADLELRGAGGVGYPFSGTVIVASGREVFVNDFGFWFVGASTVEFQGGGRYRSTGRVNFESCTLSVTSGSGIATIATDSFVDFHDDCATILMGSLSIDSALTTIFPGAEFSGAGALINPFGGTLRLIEGVTSADLGVAVINEGTLSILGPGLGGGASFEQTATGKWELHMGGIGAGAFDRMMLTGTAVLDGTLDLSLLLGYVPSLGQTLNVVSAAGGVFGQFDTVLQPTGMPIGMKFDVIYNPTLVQLRVVSVPTFTADFDHDGDVDGDDLTQWQGDFGMNADSDADGDGDSDGADFLAWQQQFGSGSAVVASSGAVPEPNPLEFALTTLACSCAFRLRRSHAS